jgi:hypothetical protein
MYTMNRCFNARKTRFLAPLPKLAVSTALCLLVATAVWLPNAQAQTAQREFPKNALRAVMVVTSPPQITLNGASERLSPGARIKGPSNTLLMSGTLTGKEVLVNYVRDHQGMIHEVWVLSELEDSVRGPKRPKKFHQNLRLPDERVRLGQDGRRAARRPRLRAHTERGRGRPDPVQHLLGAREGAGKVFSDLGRIKHLKKKGVQIGVGGCVASQEGAAIIKRAPYVDVVFGPQTLHRLPELLNQRAAKQAAGGHQLPRD